MRPVLGTRRVFEARYSLNHAPALVFPLLCPVREVDWIDGWSCEVLHTASGAAELDCVFLKDHPELGRETWYVSRHEPSRRVEFVRVSAHAAMRFVLELEAQDSGTLLTVRHIWTALDAEGAAIVKGWPDTELSRHWDWLVRALDHHLATGTLLRR